MPPGISETQWWRSKLLPSTGYADPFPPTAWTFSVTPLFRVKLDWIATHGGSVVDCGVGPFASSDHRPIWIDLKLADAQVGDAAAP